MVDATIGKSETPIYGSPLTLEKIAGIRTQMAELAGRPIIIVNREELVVFKGGQNHPVSLLDRSRLADELVDWKKTGQRLKDFFTASVAPDAAAAFMKAYAANPHKISDAAYVRAAQDMVRASGPYAEHNAGQKDGVGLIRAPDHSMTPADHVAGLTRIPAHFFTQLPGMAGDYMAIIMLHEAKHLSQPNKQGLETLPFEGDADRGGVKGYEAARAAGTPLNADIPKFFGMVREVGSLPQIGSEFFTMLKQLPMQYPGLPEFADVKKTEILPTHATHAFLGDEHGEDHEGEAAQKFLAMQRVKSFVNMVVGSQEATAQFLEIQARLAKPDAKISDQDTTFLRQHTGPGAAFRVHDIGALAVDNDAAKGYNVMKALHQSGFFKEGSEEARYVGRVNAFLETYAPTYIAEPERIAARQELVTSLGQMKDMLNVPAVGPPDQTADPTGPTHQMRTPALPQMGR